MICFMVPVNIKKEEWNQSSITMKKQTMKDLLVISMTAMLQYECKYLYVYHPEQARTDSQVVDVDINTFPTTKKSDVFCIF
jgi:hypothetical protein